jgi:hypothetical protein
VSPPEEHARAVLDEMAAHELPAWQVPLRLARRLKTLKAHRDESILLAVAEAVVEHMETLDLPEAGAVGWYADPVVLAAAIRHADSQVKWVESRLVIAEQEAAAEPIPAALANGSERLQRCFQFLARFQRLVGDKSVHPGQRRLAAVVGVSQRAVSDFLRTLQGLGLVTLVDDRFASHGRAKAYRVLIADLTRVE